MTKLQKNVDLNIENKPFLMRKDLTEHQKKIIRKKTLARRIAAFLVPWWFMLWARCYGVYIILVLINLFVPFLWVIIWWFLSFFWWAKWAFNTSKWNLRNLV